MKWQIDPDWFNIFWQLSKNTILVLQPVEHCSGFGEIGLNFLPNKSGKWFLTRCEAICSTAGYQSVAKSPPTVFNKVIRVMVFFEKMYLNGKIKIGTYFEMKLDFYENYEKIPNFVRSSLNKNCILVRKLFWLTAEFFCKFFLIARTTC